jgi:hypothetical protein
MCRFLCFIIWLMVPDVYVQAVSDSLMNVWQIKLWSWYLVWTSCHLRPPHVNFLLLAIPTWWNLLQNSKCCHFSLEHKIPIWRASRWPSSLYSVFWVGVRMAGVATLFVGLQAFCKMACFRSSSLYSESSIGVAAIGVVTHDVGLHSVVSYDIPIPVFS